MKGPERGSRGTGTQEWGCCRWREQGSCQSPLELERGEHSRACGF